MNLWAPATAAICHLPQQVYFRVNAMLQTDLDPPSGNLNLKTRNKLQINIIEYK